MRVPFERQIHHFEVLPSTNDKAKEYVQHGAKVGTTIVAKAQSAGRGRVGRTWHSPLGGLYFSVLMVPARPSRATDLSLLAGAAVAQAIRQLMPKKTDVTLKWPNDILIGNRKVAGILSESVGDETMGTCIVGVGINVNTAAAELTEIPAGPFPASSLHIELRGGSMDLGEVLDVVLTKVELLYRQYWETGFDFIRQIWIENCSMIGRRVQVENAGVLVKGSKEKTGPVIGVFAGLDANGAMVLRLEGGKEVAYYSGEITCFWP